MTKPPTTPAVNQHRPATPHVHPPPTHPRRPPPPGPPPPPPPAAVSSRPLALPQRLLPREECWAVSGAGPPWRSAKPGRASPYPWRYHLRHPSRPPLSREWPEF